MDCPAKRQVITFGCRLNACESERIQEFADELGISDFTIINTCAVTAEAERKLRQAIRKLHNENNNIQIILTGCASELNPDLYLKMDGVVAIISNKFKLSKDRYIDYSSRDLDTTEDRPQTISKKVRAFLQIQNGCDQKCTYCVVRIARGHNISFAMEDIATQAKRLLHKGYKEIALTGVNISAYGRDMNPQSNLAEIIRYLLKNVPEMKRLRLSSIDPADIDSELIDVLTSEERLMPHLHESVQSGDNMILKRMLRRHSREQIIETNEKILQLRPEMIFGADIIVGFPTETDEMFDNTKKLLAEAKVTLSHVFPFSRRPGTPAALMSPIKKSIVQNRAKELREFSSKILSAKLSEYVGKEFVVLAETAAIAKTNSFLPVKSLDSMIPGKEYAILCASQNNDQISGKIISEVS